MIVRLACGALQGVDAFRVDLEADFLRKGMPAFVMVGLAEGAVREAKERVFAAMRSCGFTLPAARITVNLAPADRRKAGSAYDLPLAVALLGAAGGLVPRRGAFPERRHQASARDSAARDAGPERRREGHRHRPGKCL